MTAAANNNDPAENFVGIRRACAIATSLTTWRVALTLVSGATTWLGLMLLYDTFGSDQSDHSIGWLRFVIPLALAGSLHAMIFRLLENWSTLRRHRLLALIIPLQLLAVAASYGTHWTHMRGASEAVHGFSRSQDALVRGLRTFSHSYGVMADSTAALAKHSDVRADVEAKVGGTCGTQARTGKGPRYDLRMNDRATFSSLNGDITQRRSGLTALVDRAEQISAASADQAMGQVAALRTIVNEAKPYEADPLLAQLRQAAQQRLSMGKGSIDIPVSRRAKGGEVAFSCPDPVLDRHLGAVIDAVAGLKSIPEVKVPDPRDPRVGFVMSLRRLARVLVTVRLPALSREELKDARRSELKGAVAPEDGGIGDDLAPLVVATAIEAVLTLLFVFGQGGSHDHPGVADLRGLIKRRRHERMFDVVWSALGGGADRGAVRTTLSRYTKFERCEAVIIVPLYLDNQEARVLHDLMILLSHVGLARYVYTGRFGARLYTFGWPRELRQNACGQGAVRIFRMANADYLAFLLDAVQGPASSAIEPSSASTQESDHSQKLLPQPGSDDRKAA